MSLAVSFLLNFILKSTWPVFWENSEILFRRIPVFIIGAYAGRYVFEKAGSFTGLRLVMISALCILIYVLLYENSGYVFSLRYPNAVLAIGAAALFSLLGKIRCISRAMSFLAPVSLEIYLCHEKILLVLTAACPGLGNIVLNAAAFILGIIGAYMLAALSRRIIARFA